MQDTYETKVILVSPSKFDDMVISGLSKAICECGWSSFSTMFNQDAIDWATFHREKAHNG